MTALGMLRKSLDDILDNPGPALRVSVLPMAILAAVEAVMDRLSGAGGLFALLLLPVYVFALFWTAVGWHRFVLAGEAPGAIAPRIHPGRTFRYAWRYVIVAVIAGLAAGGVILLAMGAVALFGAVLIGFDMPRRGMEVLTGLMGIVVFGLAAVAFLGISLRLAPALVGTAVDRTVPLGRAWRVTDPIGDRLAGMAVMVVALGGVFLLIQAVLALNGVLLGGYVVMSTWALSMLLISVLTTVHATVADRLLPDRLDLPEAPERGTAEL